MKALVTGGTGFVGAHLTSRLLADGHDVRLLDLSPGAEGDALREAGAQLVLGSVTDPKVVEGAVQGVEVVFHLASGFRAIHAAERDYWSTDVAGTRNVLEAAARHGARRVVHCSTQGVHGSLAETPGDEDSPIAPQDYYCHTKWHAEKVCHEFIERGLDVVILRPTSIYGPGDLFGWAKLHRMVRSGRFIMLGGGRTLNHPVYVGNFVDALLLGAEEPAASGRTYIIADEDYVELNELVRAVGRASGVDVRIINLPFYSLAYAVASVVEAVTKPLGIYPPIFRRRLSWFRTNRAFSIARARKELRYRPRVQLTEGLERTAAWYEEQGLIEPIQRRDVAERSVTNALP